VNKMRFDLGESVKATVDHQRAEAEQRGLELRYSSSGGPALLSTDRRLVELVLSNLIDNAIKFTTGGTVDVTVERSTDGAHRIAVADSGPGIPEAQQKRIFEPFEQLDSPAPKQRLGGIGLGLALVRDIASALGGRIELVSRPHEGSTFTFVLPLVPHDPSAPAREPRED
jgi:signal transduction histidine kinase